MLNYLFKKFFLEQNTCSHPKITPENTLNFCPDCGKEISIYWLILRCYQCDSKREGYLKLNFLYPQEKFCSKCGCNEFYVEKKAKLDISDYHWAIFVKEETSKQNSAQTQIWIEEEGRWGIHRPLLIPILTNTAPQQAR